ncbi:AraC family transcriptional regulator [Aquabacterium sp. UBA2148]|uniref:AraC family transcriptional regulator n=1 Tax=Aquabacterium sp. UBA2148 TaxID=1946042 RepID=UPI00257B6D14|nr:AraC family transcriptional regulator [Aquabacterium sp. UBA2148]
MIVLALKVERWLRSADNFTVGMETRRWAINNLHVPINRLDVMDRLSLLLQRFSLSAGVFYAGQLCGIHHFDQDPARGHVHLVRRGPVRLTGMPESAQRIEQPTLVFMPRPDAHRLIADEHEGADVVCANILFGAGGRNPITDSLPGMVLVPLADLPGAEALLSLLDEEAFTPHCGRQAALDRLCEILLIRLLRYCMDQGITQGGALAGLSDVRLSKALMALHEHPEHDWTLDTMADLAGMSRARFAVHFKEVMGQTPADYLSDWRIALAQSRLREGRPIKALAQELGYANPSALSRAFSARTGLSPRDWLRRETLGASPTS